MNWFVSDYLSEQPATQGMLPTPLEDAQFTRFSGSAEINAYLHALAAKSDLVQAETWGHSVQGQAITALRYSHPQSHIQESDRLRVVIVGSQHGASEAAGGEALLVLARQLLQPQMLPLLQVMDVILLPNANPDGRDDDSSKNANGMNLNRDYVLLSQPETHALDAALARIRPHVVLDAHESAALKRKTLGREGFLTEFEAQMDFANNPAVPQSVQAFCEHDILQPLLERIRTDGLPAQRYIKEVHSTSQALTHGAVTAKGLRNKAGICGALSFLLETKMDPKRGSYPSYRNIQVRRSKQLYCMHHFLSHVAGLATPIKSLVKSMSVPTDNCVLNADFVEHPQKPTTCLPLRRIDTQEITEIEFVNHSHLRLQAPMLRPECYYITDHVALFEELLRRHSLAIERISRAERVRATALEFAALGEGLNDDIEIQVRPMELELQTGWLRVSLNQSRGLLLPQLLEPQAGSSYFRHEHFHAMCQTDRPFFIYRG
jgi:Zinc carboxypeptidase